MNNNPQSVSPLLPEDVAEIAARAALSQKSHDVRSLIMRGVSDIADIFVVVSGTSERHVKGIADRVQLELKRAGEAPQSVGGYDAGNWVVLDYGDVIVHVFYEPTRMFYAVDDLWGKASELYIDEDFASEARRFRTGMV